eukprot:4888264-Pyramimonas_sp.AAC.1
MSAFRTRGAPASRGSPRSAATSTSTDRPGRAGSSPACPQAAPHALPRRAHALLASQAQAAHAEAATPTPLPEGALVLLRY